MKIYERITIAHPTGKFPPHPKKRKEAQKYWQDELTRIFKGVIPKTIDEFNTYTDEIDAADKAFVEKYPRIDVFEEFDLHDLIEEYGPLSIMDFEGELKALTLTEYEPEKKVKTTIKRTKRKVKQALQKAARAVCRKSKD